MNQPLFYFAGTSAATKIAATILQTQGQHFSPTPKRDVTHLLVDTPCKQDHATLLNQLSLDVTVIGGNLDQFHGYRRHDLLKDPLYLAKNAAITAHCTLQILLPLLPVTLQNCPVLILGWGRIGKCLGGLLHNLGAQVSIYARQEKDRAMATALGLEAVTSNMDTSGFRAIINTIPAPVLTQQQLSNCRNDCALVELASTPGLMGENVVSALGLPSKLAPESSAVLISQTVARLMGKETI